MLYREKTKVIKIGNKVIGGGNPIMIQSMTNTKTEDAAATVNQILRLQDAGCDIIRCTVPNIDAARAIAEIKKEISIPLVADIHFDYRMAIASYIVLNSLFIISIVTIIKEYRINKEDSLIIHQDSDTITYYTKNQKIEFKQEDIISFKYFRNHIKYNYYEIHIKQRESPIIITDIFCKDLNKYISKKYELIRQKNFINLLRNKNQS